MSLNKQHTFRVILFLMLSLKVTYVVLNHLNHFGNSDEISYVLDIEDSENEEKNELDESEKFHEKVKDVNSALVKKFKHLFFIKINYRFLHLEYTTPPPEIAS